MFHVKHFVLGRLYGMDFISSKHTSNDGDRKLFHVKQFGYFGVDRVAICLDWPISGISPLARHDR